jgi:hypothetical protein
LSVVSVMCCQRSLRRADHSSRGVVCDLETSRIGAPYIYDISNLRVKLQMSPIFTETSNHPDFFFAYSDVSPSQLISIRGVLLYMAAVT